MNIPEPFLSLWNSTLNLLPGIVGAILILILGYLVGWFFSWIVEKVLTKLKLNRCAVYKTNLCKATGDMDISKIIGLIVKWGIFALFLAASASLVQLNGLSNFLEQMALWIPNLIAAVLIALAAVIAADYAEYKIMETKVRNSSYIGFGVKIVIIVMGAIIALKQISIDVSIIEHSFLVILAGLVLAFALAIGIGFSDVVKKESAGIAKKLKRRL